MEAPSGCTIARKGNQGQHRPLSCSNPKVRRGTSAQPGPELRARSRLTTRQRQQQPEPELGSATSTERCGEGEQGVGQTLRQKAPGEGEAYTAGPWWGGSFPVRGASIPDHRGAAATGPCRRTVPSWAAGVRARARAAWELESGFPGVRSQSLLCTYSYWAGGLASPALPRPPGFPRAAATSATPPADSPRRTKWAFENG
nr:uncharacterized protein LOC109730327 [Microcebus murinus]